MMKTLIVICLILVHTFLSAQKPVVIEYARIDDFKWELFEGRINKQHLHEMGHNTGAVTVSSLSYTTLQTSPTHATVSITARFHPEESWTRYPNLKNEKEALKHEKGHLEITEIYARRIRKVVSRTGFKSHSFKDELRDLFRNIAEQHRNEQIKYDKETNHSINVENQLKWNAWIDEQLSSLSDYTAIDIKLDFHR